MSATPHTPGPWSTECNLPFGHQPRVESTAKLIAVVGNAEANCQDEWEANARLIAAAPDMLAALQRQSENIKRWLNTGIPAGPAESKSISDQIDAAIAKATGGAL
jgi:hypothetical protein